MKRTGVCPKCGSEKIGCFDEVTYYDKDSFLLHKRRLKLGATSGGKSAEIETYVCVDCGQTWDEGAEKIPGCTPVRYAEPPAARTDYLLRSKLLGSMPRPYVYWTGDGWERDATNAVRFADWKSANNVLTNVLQPFTHSTGNRVEIAPEIVT